MKETYIRMLVREVLKKGEESPATYVLERSTKGQSSDYSSEKSGSSDKNSKNSDKSEIEPQLVEGNEYVFDNWSDVFDTLVNKNQWYELYSDLYDYMKESPEGKQPSGPGFVLFGVTNYSPVGDVLGGFGVGWIADYFREQIEAYKAYGHAYTLFVDRDGRSARYEFAFDNKGICAPITRESILANIDNLLKDKKYAVELYDRCASIIGGGFGALVGGIGGSIVPGMGTLAGAATGALAGSFVGGLAAKAGSALGENAEAKSYILREIMPTLIEKYPEELGRLIHYNIPGKVYSAVDLKTHLLTGWKMGEIAIDCAKKHKIKCYKAQFSGDYIYLDFYNPANGIGWRYKIKNTVLDAYRLASKRSTNQPVGDGGAVSPVDSSTREGTIGLLVFESQNVSPGVQWCAEADANECNIPYSLPMPGRLITPETSNALNCGLFAASAANEAMSGFSFNLSNRSDVFTSPASFYEQGESAAIDSFKAGMLKSS